MPGFTPTRSKVRFGGMVSRRQQMEDVPGVEGCPRRDQGREVSSGVVEGVRGKSGLDGGSARNSLLQLCSNRHSKYETVVNRNNFGELGPDFPVYTSKAVPRLGFLSILYYLRLLILLYHGLSRE
jgi:hypothetical protein